MQAAHATVTLSSPLLRYRNRDIRESDLEFIRSTVAELAANGRRQLTATSRVICAAWGWRQANGALAVHACCDLLLRLEQWGHIQLPSRRPRAEGRRSHPLLPRELIALAWSEIRDPDADLDALSVRPIRPEERLGWRLFMDRYHYLGERLIVGENLRYAAFLDTQLVALLGWGSAALRVPARDRYVGWDEQTKRRRLHLVANNVRFLIPRWVRVRHLASKVLAYNLRRLRADWEQAWGHPVYLAESFVDTTRFRGTSYRASNWKYLGQTAGRRKRGNAYLYGSTPKAVYVYELDPDARRRLRGEEAE